MIGGLRIADRAMVALRGASTRQIVIANDERAERWFPNVHVVRDAMPGLGPLAGVHTALMASEGAPVLVVAWDMPFVTSALLSALRALGEAGASAVVPAHGSPLMVEPLCAYYSPQALAVCERLLTSGERRAHALFDALPGARRLEGPALAALGDPSWLLRSVDTTESLAALGGSLPPGEDAARR
jgi:molybdopterin-guanine dinucleotide biosynthesis protein A